MKAEWLAAAIIAVASPAFAGTTVFTDNEFSTPGLYNLTTYANPGFVTSITNPQGAGGPGDASLSLLARYEKFGATSPGPRFQALNNTFIYDPSLQGEISSIDASADQFITVVHQGTNVSLNVGMQLRVLAEQGDDLYEAFFSLPERPIFGQWTPSSKAGILATDFTLFDPANPFAVRTQTGLDFAGGAIRFGFELTPFGVSVNGQPPTADRITISQYGVDNFSLTLHTLDAVAGVPEPGTWAMMILGFGLAGTGVRGRKRAMA